VYARRETFKSLIEAYRRGVTSRQKKGRPDGGPGSTRRLGDCSA
jgi:hypothetical protein